MRMRVATAPPSMSAMDVDNTSMGDWQNVFGGTAGTIIGLAYYILLAIAMWKVFTKAGKPGWACIIPIYNVIVLLQIAKRPVWWFLLFLVPVVNFIIIIVVSIDIAKAFGKGAGFGLGLAFLGPIFYPILGFSDAAYTG